MIGSLEQYLAMPKASQHHVAREHRPIRVNTAWLILESPIQIRHSSLEDLAAIPGARCSEWLDTTAALEGSVLEGYDIRICDASMHPLAWISVLKPEATGLVSSRAYGEAELRAASYVTRVYAAPGEQRDSLVAVLLYAALRRSRIWGRRTMFAYLADDAPAADWLQMRRLANMPTLTDGRTYVPMFQRVDYALHRTYTMAATDIRNEYLATEILETLCEYYSRLWTTSWFCCVFAGTLTREQYVYTLMQMYQFVRQTTRILGLAVAVSNQAEMRAHFARHLAGEVNHEVIIESDLEYLGEDVTYMKENMAPNDGVKTFMCAEEAAIAFYRDPVLLMAAPLAAEGIGAHLDVHFVRALEQCIASWGVDDPQRAMQFITSHIEVDGGDDGHWLETVKTLAKYLNSETILAHFLGTLRLTTHGLEHAYNSFVDDLSIVGARPAVRH